MGFLDDAASFIQKRKACEKTETKELNVNREEILCCLKRIYENATLREIERALDRVVDQEGGRIPEREVLLKKIRVYLED